MYDSLKMYDLAYAFFNTGEINFREGVYRNRADYQNVVGIVNYAFACELFMKCLLNMKGIKAGGHQLKDLWGKYRNSYNEEASEVEEGVMNILTTKLSFDQMLQNVSNVFYNYRYFYEPDRMDEIKEGALCPQFLRVLARELCSFVHKKLKERSV